MDVPERRDRDAVREVEVRLARHVVQPVAFTMAPLDLEVAPEDRGEVRSGRDRRVHSAECSGRPCQGEAGSSVCHETTQMHTGHVYRTHMSIPSPFDEGIPYQQIKPRTEALP
jgi:hypothetical protein